MIYNKITRLLSLMAIVLFFSACDKDDPVQEVEYTYDGTNFEANTEEEFRLLGVIANLAAELKKGRTGEILDYSKLKELAEIDNFYLRGHSSNYTWSKMVEPDGWLAELADASGNTYSPGPPSGNGGVYGGYLFNQHGLELEQAIEKGLYVASMYQHAANLVDELEFESNDAVADQVVAIFGAHPDFSNSDNSSLPHPDTYTAKYTARRDKNDGTGLYTQMIEAIAKLQTANAAGEAMITERNEAAEAIKNTWEKAIFATIVNYLHATISKLSNTNPSDADKAAALHDYSEAVGFLDAWHAIAASQRLIHYDQISELLELLRAPYDGTPTSYLFVTDPVNELPKLTQAIEKIQEIYGFTDEEIQDFKENWVSVQGR